jgi:hypothetical protein
MSDYPQDVIAAANRVCRLLDIRSTLANCIPIMDAILAEREKCAQSLEALVERRREENPKRHLGNDYILSCVRYIRSRVTP